MLGLGWGVDLHQGRGQLGRHGFEGRKQNLHYGGHQVDHFVIRQQFTT